LEYSIRNLINEQDEEGRTSWDGRGVKNIVKRVFILV
jgi:hypothetical protein